MAKAKREKTRYPAVYKVNDRYEWISKRSNTRGMADTLKEAYEAKLRADGSGQIVTVAARGSFGNYAQDWIDTYQGRTSRGFSESTRIGYRSNLERWAIPYFDTVRPRKFAQISKPDMRAFITWLANPNRQGLPPKRAGQILSRSTIQRVIAPIRAMYEDAIEDGVLNHANPASVRINVQAAQIDPDADEDVRAFTRAQLAGIKAAINERDRLLIDTLAELGLRWGEVAELRGQDLHHSPRGPVLRVRRSYSVKTKTIKTTKSGFGRRDLPLSPALARRLWRQQRASGLLFTAPEGGRLSYSNARRRILVPILDRASDAGHGDVTWAGFHTFRHTCASLMFDQGRNVKQVQRWLGHHKASYTLDIYVHLMGDDIGDPLDVDAILAIANTEQTMGECDEISPEKHAIVCGYLHCARPFVPAWPTQRYCSRGHKERARKMRARETAGGNRGATEAPETTRNDENDIPAEMAS